MVRTKNKFVETARAIYKGKAIAGATGPPPKGARRAEEIIILPPPPPPLATNEIVLIQPESSSRGDLVAILIQADPSREEVGAGATWPRGIQHLALALIRTTSCSRSPVFQSSLQTML